MTRNKHSHHSRQDSSVGGSKRDAQGQTPPSAVPRLLPWICGSRMCTPTEFLALPPWVSICHGLSPEYKFHYGFPSRCPGSLLTLTPMRSHYILVSPHNHLLCPSSSCLLESQACHTLPAPAPFLWNVGGSLPTLAFCIPSNPASGGQYQGLPHFSRQPYAGCSVGMTLSRESILNKFIILYLGT